MQHHSCLGRRRYVNKYTFTNAERAVVTARSAFVQQPGIIFPCIIYFFSVGLFRYNVKI